MSILLCDLGGTHTRFGLARGGQLDVETMRRVKNDDYADFDAVVGNYMRSCNADTIDTAVIALAAPAEHDIVELTNREWQIAKPSIASISGARVVYFINDYTALAAALIDRDSLEVAPVISATPDVTGQRLILGAGTGFNCACLLPGHNGEGHRILTAEAGHAAFAAHGELATELRDDIILKYGRCSFDRVLSGSGLVALYLRICRRNAVTPRHIDPATIATDGLAGTDEESTVACIQFVEILARTAGDLALTYLATGGVYITGGVARSLLPFITSHEGTFAKTFLDKGRMSGFMERFPVGVVTDDHTALGGCLAWLEMIETSAAIGGRPEVGV